MTATMDIGLFPLGLALVPGERVPLHIFEPRYRALVADCVLEDQPFVLALAGTGGVARIGCTARFENVVRRFADGRMNVIVAGRERVEILQQTEGHLYLSALVRPVADAESAIDPGLEEAVLARFRRLAQQVAGEAQDPGASPEVPLSYAVAGTVDLDALSKQVLLEERDESERLRRLVDMLDQALAGIDRQQVASDRAQSNGKVTLG